MSTTTPTTAETEMETTTEDRSRPGTTAMGRPDRWAAPSEGTGRGPSATAPLTFDPFCTRRLRNCIDEENTALPDAR